MGLGSFLRLKFVAVLLHFSGDKRNSWR